MSVIGLLKPTLKGFIRSTRQKSPTTIGLLILGAIIIILAIFVGLYFFLEYLSRAPMLGNLMGPVVGRVLVGKLLEMLFLALLTMLFFSSIVACFSVFYLDEELKLLFSSPTRPSTVFWSRFVMMVGESSWMAAAFFLPVFLAFAAALKAPLWAMLVFMVYLGIYLLLPNLGGGILALLLAALFPIRQMKKVFQFLSITVLAGMIIFFRFMEPEKLLNPGQFERLSKYILAIQNPVSEYSPSTWIQTASLSLFQGNLQESLEKMAPIFAIFFLGLLILHFLSTRYYSSSWQASLEAVENQVLGLEWLRSLLVFPFRFFPADFRVIASKEITVFFRDPAIFSQIFMMGAIIFVYGYNLTILPLKDIPTLYSGEANDSMVYFNGPFIGFILAALAMRFVYPSISIEGRAFWAVKASPVSPERLLKIKFLLYLVPMTAVGMILCYISNNIFEVTTSYLYWLSFLNVLLMSTVITALAIGLGALYARFDMENPLKIAGSFGGFVFMVACGTYILNLLILEAYPLFLLYFARFYQFLSRKAMIFTGFSFFLLFLCSVAWVLIPFWKGQEAIHRYEPE